MSISPESFVRREKEDLQYATVEQARDILNRRISVIADYIKSGSDSHLRRSFDDHSPKDHETAYSVLFNMSGEPMGMLSTDSDALLMEKGVLQQTALEVMAEYGFDEDVYILTARESSFERHVYPSQTIDRLAFTRLLMTTEQGKPISVVWEVHDRDQLLPERAISETVTA